MQPEAKTETEAGTEAGVEGGTEARNEIRTAILLELKYFICQTNTRPLHSSDRHLSELTQP